MIQSIERRNKSRPKLMTSDDHAIALLCGLAACVLTAVFYEFFIRGDSQGKERRRRRLFLRLEHRERMQERLLCDEDWKEISDSVPEGVKREPASAAESDAANQ